MPSRAAKAVKVKRQSKRDKTRHLEERRRLREGEYYRAEDEFEERSGIRRVMSLRGGTLRAVVVIAADAHPYRTPVDAVPWFHPSLSGSEPLQVALRDTPPNKDVDDLSAPWDSEWEPRVDPREWPRQAEVAGLVAAVETVADWLDWPGDRAVIPAVLALGGLQTAMSLVSD